MDEKAARTWLVKLRRTLEEVVSADPDMPSYTATLDEAEELLAEVDAAHPAIPRPDAASPCCSEGMRPEFVGAETTYYRCSCGRRFRVGAQD